MVRELGVGRRLELFVEDGEGFGGIVLDFEYVFPGCAVGF